MAIASAPKEPDHDCPAQILCAFKLGDPDWNGGLTPYNMRCTTSTTDAAHPNASLNCFLMARAFSKTN
eukprot:12910617-Prorocentrum_lima.AAC.1